MIRADDNGDIYLVKNDPKLEAILDAQYKRIGHLKWRRKKVKKTRKTKKSSSFSYKLGRSRDNPASLRVNDSVESKVENTSK